MLNTLISLFCLGISFGAGPCLASCGPILISYVAGTKKGGVDSFLAYVVFSLARIFVYLVLAILIFFLGKIFTERFLGAVSKYIYISGGVFIIVIGLLIVIGKNLNYKSCQFLMKNFLERDKKSIFTLGLIIGLLPCGPLLALFSYIAIVSKSWINSLLYSLTFGLGTFVSPLIVLTVLSGCISRFITTGYERIFRFVCGIIVIFLGIQLLIRSI